MTIETSAESSGLSPRFSDGIVPVLTIENLHHELGDERSPDRFTITVQELRLPLGKFVGLLGPNACGKTTLLTILGLLRRPQCRSAEQETDRRLSRFSLKPWPWRKKNNVDERAGRQVVSAFKLVKYEYVNGSPSPAAEYNLAELWSSGDDAQIEQLRRELFGFCLQSGELLSNLTAVENIEMPPRLNGKTKQEAHQKALELLETLGILRVERFLPGQLAGSQSQRVAIARAISHQPQIVFVDEPTNNLARGTARKALDTLCRLSMDRGITVVMITHDVVLAEEFCDFVVCMDSRGGNQGYIREFWRKERPKRWWRVNSHWYPREDCPEPHSTIPFRWDGESGGETDAKEFDRTGDREGPPRKPR